LIKPIPDFEVNSAHILKIPVSKISGVIFTDVEDASLSTSLAQPGKTTLPGFITFANDTIRIYPMISDTGKVALVLKATDSGGAFATDTFNITVLGYITGVKEIQQLSVSLFPNPTNGRLNLVVGDYQSGLIEIEVYSIDGGLKIREQFTERASRIDVRQLTDGMYYLKVKNGPAEVIKNFVLRKEK
jgi:hypothetical protein